MEKDYIVWLQSGASVVGSITDKTAKYIESAFSSRKRGVLKFDDADGKMIVKIENISAIAINSAEPQTKISGF